MIEIPLSTTLPLYTGMLICWPVYPVLCLMNQAGGGGGDHLGYYNFIPVFMLPHDQRPAYESWPGVRLHPIFG